MNNQKLEFDVVVVGAGVSGLTAARDVVAAGLSVGVLEAKDACGGRTLTLDAGGVPLDAGAQWLGPTQTAVLGLCEELGIETFPSATGAAALVSEEGERSVDGGTSMGLSIWEQLDYVQIVLRLDRLARQLDPAASWTHRRAGAWDALTFGDWLRRRVLTGQVREAMRTVALTSFGRDPAELSLLGVLHHIATAGGLEILTEDALRLRVSGGTGRIATRLHEDLETRVRTGAAVHEIAHQADGARLITGDGVVSARRVIVAMDPSAADAITFTPGLPDARAKLQHRWRQGAGRKGFAVYDGPWWRDLGLSGTGAMGGPVPFVFDASPADRPEGVLGFFVESGVDAAARREAATEALVALFGAEAAGFDYYEKDWGSDSKDPQPIGRSPAGCVPGLGLGVLSRYGAALTEPVGVIHWAGAESSPVWDAHVEGAVRAGQRAAAEVIAALSARDDPR